MKINSIASKVSLGVFIIIVVMCVIVGFNVSQHISINQYSKQSFEQDVPATQLSLNIKFQLARALEALRGWSTIGDNLFRQEFNKAWQEIASYQNALILLEEDNTSNNQKLNLLSIKLNQLEALQREVINIAQTAENFPGIKLLNIEVEPKVKQLLSLITEMIEIESANPPSEQNFSALKQMADFRATLATSISSMRIYLLSRNDEYRVRQQALWHQNSLSFERLNSFAQQLTPKQNQILTEIDSYRELYALLPEKLIDLRNSNEWDVANKLLDEEVAPLDNETRNLIDEIYKGNEKQMKANMADIAQSQQLAYDISIISLVIGIILSLAITYLLTRMITNPIEQVLKIANSISRGNFNVDTNIKGAHEVTMLSLALANMLQMLRRVASHAQAVAKGNYTNQFVPSSNDDQLGQAIQQMSENLAETTHYNEIQNWSTTGIASFSTKLQGLTDIEQILPVMINFIGDYFDIQVGALYLLKDGKLKLSASYAFSFRNNSDTEYKIGQGLVGQAAKERKTIIFNHPQADSNPLEINTGINTSLASNVIVCPLINQQSENSALVGVFVLGTEIPLNPTQVETLEKIALTAATTIEMTQSRIKLQELLEESQVQAEELQAQQEELRVANEELEQQTNILKEAQADQQRQSEKLTQTNEDLQRQSSLLEEQKRALENKNKEIEKAKQQVEDTAREIVQASKYKSEFLANMSHELRTPLNSLLILSETLMANDDNNLTPEQIEDLEIIHGGGNKLLNLINDILDLAKVESGKLTIINEDFQIAELAKNMQLDFEPVANKKKLTFNVLMNENIPQTLCTDINRLEQILRNLVSNALKFTDIGQVTLSFSSTQEATVLYKLSQRGTKAVSDALQIQVVDTGLGIAPDAQQEIFEAFQQGDGSTSRKYGGTGLGLTISRELSHLLGGYITLESKPNKGSTFTLYLPLNNTKSNKTNTNTNTNIESNAPHELLIDYAKDDEILNQIFIEDDRETITSNESNLVLIIEDDADFAQSLIKIAHQREFKCVATNSGRNGLALVNRYPISAIILDLGLPDFSGTKVLEGLKASPATRDIPVHIISGRDEQEQDTQHAIGFLTKPADIHSLNQVFNRFNQVDERPIKHVLMIEDDVDNCHALKKLFSNKNIDVHNTEFGEEAIALITKNHYDCIVLDLTLGDMNGIQWFEQCQAQGLNLPPVVVYTAEELTDEKYKQLLNFTNSIVIKGTRSAERLIDEVVLFLTSSNKQIEPPKANAQANEKAIFTDKKILLVDDDLRNTYALSKVLKAKGMNIIIADNGEMAVQKLAKEKDIDLILMDIMMPVMDGYEAIKQIRQQHQHPYPIIALTAKAMAEDRQHCLNAGANDYLTKPVETNKLLEMVKLWLYQ